MMLRTSLCRLGTALALTLCAAAPLHAARGPALPAIEKFFANPVLAGAKLSPNARYLAAISGQADRRDFLVVIDLQAKALKVVAGYNDVDIRQFQWVNDNRLVFDVTDKRVAVGQHSKAAGLYAVDRDGGIQAGWRAARASLPTRRNRASTAASCRGRRSCSTRRARRTPTPFTSKATNGNATGRKCAP
jgi:hypothetical protein